MTSSSVSEKVQRHHAQHVCSPQGVKPSQLDQADSLEQSSIVHAVGWLFSCACALWLQLYLSAATLDPQYGQSWQNLLLPQIVSGFWVTAAAAVATDLLNYQSATTAEYVEGQRLFCCGNFGLMLADSCNQSASIVKVPPSSIQLCTNHCAALMLPLSICLEIQ